MEDMVKSPKHYTEGRQYEPKDVIRDWGLNFNLGSAVKYLARAGRKDDIVQDLEKAREYIAFEIEAIQRNRSKEVKPQTEERKKAQRKAEKEMIHGGARCKCSFNPIFADMEDGRGITCGVMEVQIPAEADPEDIIKAVIEKLYGGN